MMFACLLFLWEQRPRRDGLSQTTTHRPEGGAPTGLAVLKKSCSLQTSQHQIHGQRPPACSGLRCWTQQCVQIGIDFFFDLAAVSPQQKAQFQPQVKA